MIALWKIGVSVSVIAIGVIAFVAERARLHSSGQTRAAALAAFDLRQATMKVPAGATPTPVSEAQRQAWADGWLASAARGNTQDSPKTCDGNWESSGRPTSPDLSAAYVDGWFSRCGIRVEDLFK